VTDVIVNVAVKNHLHGLNTAQRDAVSTLSGPLLVLAGAGTGKTRVITHRMAELIRSGIAPERILSVTFTNKAAREMKERAMLLLGKSQKTKPVVSTFHSFCVKVLRADIHAIGYPQQFAILDRSDQESAARTALRDIRVTDKAMKPNDLLSVISRWKMSGIHPDFAADHTDHDLEFLAAVAYRKYQSNLRSRGAVDFDDLLLLTQQLFEEHPDLLGKYQQQFDRIQIDEYQDTNATQFNLIDMLVEPHGNLCVVGDDDQSIYGWRGAEVTHILKFTHHFPGAKVVRLEENYRCTEQILSLANCLVAHNPARHKKRLIASKRSPHEVRLRVYDNENEEAERIAREIAFLNKTRNVPFADIAILFRTNEQPRPFEAELRRMRIPYVLIGGQSFFDRKEIRDLLAYLKVLQYPKDEPSLMRILNTPPRGISDRTKEKLLNRAISQQISIWEAVPAALSVNEISTKAAAAVTAFERLLDRFRDRMQNHPRKLHETLKQLIEEIHYQQEIERQYKEEQQQQARLAVVEQLVDAVAYYVQQAANPALAGFLEETALLGRDEEADKDDQLSEQGVKLMTLHCAKGLEFPRVYLVGWEEGLLPHRRSLEADEKAIAEERRLAYVGITRAMDHLTISRADSRMKWGKRRQSIPSRFLAEMQNRVE